MDAWLGWGLIVLGGSLFAAGLVTENPWLLASGLVLVPVGTVSGLVR